MPRVIRLGVFSPSVVTRFGQSKGIFGAAGVALRQRAVGSSVEAFRGLDDGSLDVLVTSPDNVLAYRLNASNVLGRRLDAQILLGVDRGLGLSLVAAPGVDDPAALREQRLAVDAPATGFAFAAYALLARIGLDDAMHVVQLGATPRRRAALVRGECAATMLNAGHDLLAEDAGCRRMLNAVEVLGPYLGSVLVARQSWVSGNGPLVGQLVAAWRETTARILDPVSAPVVVDTLATMLQCRTEVAERVRRIVVSPTEGLLADGAVEEAGLQTVINLRAANGGFDDPAVPSAASARELGMVYAEAAGPARNSG